MESAVLLEKVQLFSALAWEKGYLIHGVSWH